MSKLVLFYIKLESGILVSPAMHVEVLFIVFKILCILKWNVCLKSETI